MLNRSRLIATLREVCETASMQKATFSRLHPNYDDDDGPLPTEEKQVTEFIKKRTYLWRQSWLVRPLTELIDALESLG